MTHQTGTTQDKSDLRIGYEVPAHLFVDRTGESLCGRARDRRDLTADEVRNFTKSLSFPLGRLRSAEQIADFAASICGHCFRAYEARFSNRGCNTLLDTYSVEIAEEAGRGVTLGFCEDCGVPVDAERVGTAEISGLGIRRTFTCYVCEVCCTRAWSGLWETLGQFNPDTKPAFDNLQKGSEQRLKESDEEPWNPYHRRNS